MNPVLGCRLLALRLKRARLAARAVAGLAVILAAVAGPVAQLLRIQEVAAPQTRSGRADAPHYRMVWADEQQAETKNEVSGAKSDGPKPPRLLKPLADHWEAGARVQLDSADAPSPVAPCHPQDCEEPPTNETATAVCLSYEPPNPPARGPPSVF